MGWAGGRVHTCLGHGLPHGCAANARCVLVFHLPLGARDTHNMYFAWRDEAVATAWSLAHQVWGSCGASGGVQLFPTWDPASQRLTNWGVGLNPHITQILGQLRRTAAFGERMAQALEGLGLGLVGCIGKGPRGCACTLSGCWPAVELSQVDSHAAAAPVGCWVARH